MPLASPVEACGLSKALPVRLICQLSWMQELASLRRHVRQWRWELTLRLYDCLAIATAGNVPAMAEAFKKAIEAGRSAYLTGMGRVLARGGSASDPLTGFLR